MKSPLKATDVSSEKRCDHRQTLKSRDCWGNSLSMADVVRMKGSTETTTATPTTNTSDLTPIRCNLQYISMPAAPNIHRSSATYGDSTHFSRVCQEKSHRLAKWPFIPNDLREKLAVQREWIWIACPRNCRKCLHIRRQARLTNGLSKSPEKKQPRRARKIKMSQ